MNRALRRKFERYAQKNGMIKAANKYLIGEEKVRMLKSIENTKRAAQHIADQLDKKKEAQNEF